MKTKRIKAETLRTRVDFECTIERIACATTELRQAEAARDQAIQEIQAAFAPRITELEQEIDAKVILCESYAEENRELLLPGKAKSAETPFARYGFALSNKKAVKPVSKKILEETIIATLKANHLGDYVRVVEEIARDKIITDAIFEEQLKEYVLQTPRGGFVVLKEIGLKLVQGEKFFIEPKVEGADQVKAGGAS